MVERRGRPTRALGSFRGRTLRQRSSTDTRASHSQEISWRTAYLTEIGRAVGNTQASLGHEIDASLKWSPWEPVSLEAGYSALLLGGGARAILLANGIGRLPANGTLSTASLSHFAYAQATWTIP